MRFIDGADFFVRVVDLPVGVGGCVSPNADGTYNVYINACYDRRKQRESYKHEVRHIVNGDFGKSDVCVIENL